MDGGFRFMQGTIQFPYSIVDSSQPIQENGDVWGMKTVFYKINNYVSKQFPAAKGFANYVELGVPVVIRSVYATKGRAYVDTSLYELKYTGVTVEETTELTGPKFVGLMFVAHLSAGHDVPAKFLDEAFLRGVSQLRNK